MKLARKLTLALVACMCSVLTVHAWYAVRREVAYSESGMKRDAHNIGRVLRLAAFEIWRRDGQARALQMIDDANEEDPGVRIRWVWLNAPENDPYVPRAPKSVLAPVALGYEVSYAEPTGNLVRTYFPASIENGRPGAIEISETTSTQQRYIQHTISNHVVTTVAMAAICGVLTILLGGWFVGRPIRSLVHKARRVGAGDLSGPLILTQRDEIRVLADEMNAMCERLSQTKEELSDATSATIAALEQLRHADRLMTVGKLASGIAHELGTPLNVVTGRARMLEGATEEERRECAEIIVSQAQRMTAIIRQLLDFARRRGAHKSSQDLRQLARQTVGLLTPLADKKGITLVVDEGDKLVTEVDPAQMQQALTNLIVNALQAMPKSGTIRIGMTLNHAQPPADFDGPEGEYVSLSVSDQGVGMSSETIAHIFEPFFTTKAVGEGTGLGLSVTYGIVREHGGWLVVESQLGEGSCFTVFLPKSTTHVTETVQEAHA